MSYHVTIVRTKGRLQEAISKDEVLALAASRDDLVLNEAEGGKLYISIAQKGASSPILVWQQGEIWTKTPDDETLQLMIDLARGLNARVRGEELETYSTPDHTYLHPDDIETSEKATQYTRLLVRQTRRRRWVVHGLIFGIMVLLGLVVAYLERR